MDILVFLEATIVIRSPKKGLFTFPFEGGPQGRFCVKYFSICWFSQWLFLVPVKGDRWYIIPELAVYTTYIPLIYGLLGCYMLHTTFLGEPETTIDLVGKIIASLRLTWFPAPWLFNSKRPQNHIRIDSLMTSIPLRKGSLGRGCICKP